ncbi:FemAB family XrtA/PEP-CTERM system-associated protein [Geoalkalibacter sp.]|uniref:FemAB family XrtA/PEP-CTERM system-associated protein n=1 Tax=Geoalkalibacter sp. TaxID=3041440 RepID=UPI00272DD3DD|nr:FemAB family XrtA/PEP-CTERM system-associated protein [Geoalkalibacter sp.]
MNIRGFQESDGPAWDEFVLSRTEGTAYQLTGWKQAVESAYGFRGAYLLAKQGSTLRGVLPLIDFRVPLAGRALISLPYCDAGGVLADSAEVAEALYHEALVLAERRGARCTIRSTAPLAFAGEAQTGKVRMLLDLPSGSAALLSSLKSKLRSQVNKPARDGLTTKLGGAELVGDFYGIFSANMRDLGSPVHSRRWIEAVVSAYGQRARVAVVYTPHGKAAAAGIVLRHATTISIPWASSLRKYNNLNANMLLYWTFLSQAADEGFKVFDFGRSTPGEGTYRFKEQWGARPHPLHWYEAAAATRQGTDATPSRKRRMAAALWSRMPEAGTLWLGPRIRKYISL